jgi:hypothetical protein
MHKRIESHGVLARKLVEGGIPQKLLSVGIRRFDKSDRAILFFRPYGQYQERNINNSAGDGPDLRPKAPETGQ